MSLVVALVAVLSLLLVGSIVAILLDLLPGLRMPLEWLPIAFAAGAVVVANWGLLQVATLTVIHPAWLVAIATALFLAKSRYIRPRPFSLPSMDRWHILAAGLGLFVAVRLGLGLLASMDDEMGWDGLFIWGLKAKMLMSPEIEYFTDVWLWHTHPDYPLLLPSLEAWTYHWAGFLDLRAVKWVSPLSLAMSSLLVYLGLRHYRGPASSAVFALAVILPTPSVDYNRFAYADLTLGAFFLGVVVYGCQYVRARDRSLLLPMALFLLAAMLTKKEGLLLALAVLTALTVTLLPQGLPHVVQALKTTGAAVLLGFGPWMLLIWIVRPLSYDFVGISLDIMVQAIRRTPEITARLYSELMSWDRWGATWLSWPMALAVFPGRWTRPEVVFVAIVVLLPMALYAVSYGFTTYSSPVAHMNVSLDRLFLHLTPAYLFAAGVGSSPGGQKPILDR